MGYPRQARGRSSCALDHVDQDLRHDVGKRNCDNHRKGVIHRAPYAASATDRARRADAFSGFGKRHRITSRCRGRYSILTMADSIDGLTESGVDGLLSVSRRVAICSSREGAENVCAGVQTFHLFARGWGFIFTDIQKPSCQRVGLCVRSLSVRALGEHFFCPSFGLI